LRGPPAESYLFGLGRHINNSPDPDELYQCWAEEYGSVYRIPCMMGASTVMITDPKGIVHFYTRGAFGYMQTKLMRLLMDIMVSTLDELVNHWMRIINIHRLDKGYCLLEARHTEYSKKPSPQHSAMQPSKKSPCLLRLRIWGLILCFTSISSVLTPICTRWNPNGTTLWTPAEPHTPQLKSNSGWTISHSTVLATQGSHTPSTPSPTLPPHHLYN